MFSELASRALLGGGKENPAPPGVSVYHLENFFLQEVVSAGLDERSNFYAIDTDVVRPKGQKTLCPEDGKLGASYVNCLEGEDHAGPSTFMLSWAWQ